ncbi:YwlC protein [Pisolithus orientalis]|uniref:YwlC protein n=1 Tax=Pisolithus orientalis TaxID=936130 RepID=UPI002224746D|nr:YwlC protein [Pisolithus orientalis]KAI6035314.1 YwlC protein [Pisolithus orientalis]
MASQHSRLYRRLVREVAKASIAPRSQRNQEISTNFRTLFERNHQSETFQHDVEDVLTFMHSQRQYKTLLERYNPLVDLTAEERIEATARRSSETLAAIRTASRHLVEDLQTVAFPTETPGYLLPRVRPPDNPLIVHVSSQYMLLSLLPAGYTIPSTYRVLIEHFWPGPLTLLFPRDPAKIPKCPSHPVARALIAISGSPLAAPSANSSGKPSPTRLILDGGFCDVGMESIRVLRPGGVPVEDIERVLQQNFNQGAVPKVLVYRRDFLDEDIEQAPTTPGMKYRHYSPSVPVKLLWTISKPPPGVEVITPLDLLYSLKRSMTSCTSLKVGLMTPSDSSIVEGLLSDAEIQWHQYVLGSSAEPAVTAQRLFDGLLTLEKAGVDIILIEEVSEDREGLGHYEQACWITMSA